MGSTFKGLRCSDCMGNLEFNKISKIWVCPYCGKEFERDLRTDDNVSDITDVVRATLSDISKFDLDSAKRNLSECEKMNANHIGTLIANISFHLFNASSSKSKEDAEKFLAKTKYYINVLNKDFSQIYEDEKCLYDYFNNPDIYAILYITYDSIGSSERAEIVYNYFDVETIVDAKIINSLITVSIKRQRDIDIEKLIKKTNLIDKRFVLNEILKKLPDSEVKRNFVTKLLLAKAFEDKEIGLVNNYIKTTNDSTETKFIVLSTIYQSGILVNLTEILNEIFSKCNSYEEAIKIFESLASIKLKKDDVQIVLDYCLSEKCQSSNVALKGLEYLKSSGGLFEVDDKDIIQFLENKKIDEEIKVDVFGYIFSLFRVSNKSCDLISEYVLLQCKMKPENRYKMLEILFSKIKSLTIKVLETYVINCSLDGEYKIEILKKIFSLGMNTLYFNTLLDKYLINSKDKMECKVQIIEVLINNKLKCTPQNLSKFILSLKGNMAKSLINLLEKNNLYPDSNTISTYFENITERNDYDHELVDYLMKNKISISSKCLHKYIFEIYDNSQRKQNIMIQFIRSANSLDFTVRFKHQGNLIEGNLLQAYLLVSEDEIGIKLNIINELSKYLKLKEDMIVMGRNIKFKKYIIENKEKLSPDTNNLCETLGVYKLFF